MVVAQLPGRWPPRSPVRRATGLRTYEFALCNRGLGPVAGVDEAGRGACAGPLVVAACVLRPTQPVALAGLNDSKKLSPAVRERLYGAVCRNALAYAIVVIESTEIDRIGVHVANIEGMRRAIAQLSVEPGYVLSDGFPVPGLPMPSLPVIGGDGNAACIAAASILAKVSRDRIMTELDATHPGYGFAVHKGYSTAQHMHALDRLGPSLVHRHSYRNVRDRRSGLGLTNER